MLAQTMWKSAATVGQYLLPFVCLAGAGMSAWRRKERQSLVANVTQNKAVDALDGISWREFEMLVGEGFRLQASTSLAHLLTQQMQRHLSPVWPQPVLPHVNALPRTEDRATLAHRDR